MKYLFILSIIAIILTPYEKPVIEVQGAVQGTVQAVTPTPTATPTPKYVPKSEIEAMICKLWGDECEDALAVARCESGLKPNAIGDGALAYIKDGVEYGKSYGVFQIRHLPSRPEPSKLLDPVFNIQYAYNNIFVPQGGWQAWSCKKVLANY